jgi:iron complex outermembrane receptor protein
MFSHGSKGNPVYLGTDNLTRKRYWRWPYWDKESAYYISRTTIGSSSVLKIRAYYDRFKNKLSNYDDASYTTQQKVGFASTYYNDYTLGGNVEFKSNWNDENNLLLSVHLKNDNHSEHNNNEPVRHFSDNTLSAGAENVFKPTIRLSLIPGISFNLRQSLRAEMYDASYNIITDYPSNSNSVFNAQLAAGYMISAVSDVNYSIAWKSRFATMKDRYSYRLGTVIPNPALKSETAINMELGSTIRAGGILEIRPELFMSILGNTIQLVSHVQDDLSQVRNTGRSVFRGFDLSAKYRPAGFIEVYAAYSFILQRNLSNPDILFTGVPKNKLFSSVEFFTGKRFRINVFSEYNSRRYTSSDGIRVSPGYFLLNTRAAYSFARYFTAEAGINNIEDRNYTIEEGYPEEGRNFYVALSLDMASGKWY